MSDMLTGTRLNSLTEGPARKLGSETPLPGHRMNGMTARSGMPRVKAVFMSTWRLLKHGVEHRHGSAFFRSRRTTRDVVVDVRSNVS